VVRRALRSRGPVGDRLERGFQLLLWGGRQRRPRPGEVASQGWGGQITPLAGGAPCESLPRRPNQKRPTSPGGPWGISWWGGGGVAGPAAAAFPLGPAGCLSPPSPAREGQTRDGEGHGSARQLSQPDPRQPEGGNRGCRSHSNGFRLVWKALRGREADAPRSFLTLHFSGFPTQARAAPTFRFDGEEFTSFLRGRRKANRQAPTAHHPLEGPVDLRTCISRLWFACGI
jgi:hypothetical protein